MAALRRGVIDAQNIFNGAYKPPLAKPAAIRRGTRARTKARRRCGEADPWKSIPITAGIPHSGVSPYQPTKVLYTDAADLSSKLRKGLRRPERACGNGLPCVRGVRRTGIPKKNLPI